jgi:hypothetical protein
VAAALHKAKVLDMATWTTGASGSTWFLAAHYSAMMNDTTAMDPREAFEGMAEHVERAIFADTFNANGGCCVCP